jgi:nicotinate-nucleotide pyrophosphorylase (carboxylating)
LKTEARLKTNPPWKDIRLLLRQALEEDGAFQDRTTLATIPSSLRARGFILAKQAGILAGLPVAAEIFRLLNNRCGLKALVPEGMKVRPGQKVATLSGPARGFLSGERTALNLLGRLSGIATLTRQMRSLIVVDKLFDTRKTTPLLRPLERYAVRVGGGRNHRYNLQGHVLIKDNHLKLGGGVYPCVTAARKKYGPREFIEVEVETFDEASDALRAGADLLLVDNSSPALVKRVLTLVKGKAQVEISGGLTKDSIKKFKGLAVDRFSSGALTHSAPSVDFSLEMEMP